MIVLYTFCVVKFWKTYVKWKEKCMFLNYIPYDCYHVYNKLYAPNFYGLENIINSILLMLLFMKYLVGASLLICYQFIRGIVHYFKCLWCIFSSMLMHTMFKLLICNANICNSDKICFVDCNDVHRNNKLTLLFLQCTANSCYTLYEYLS